MYLCMELALPWRSCMRQRHDFRRHVRKTKRCIRRGIFFFFFFLSMNKTVQCMHTAVLCFSFCGVLKISIYRLLIAFLVTPVPAARLDNVKVYHNVLSRRDDEMFALRSCTLMPSFNVCSLLSLSLALISLRFSYIGRPHRSGLEKRRSALVSTSRSSLNYSTPARGFENGSRGHRLGTERCGVWRE